MKINDSFNVVQNQDNMRTNKNSLSIDDFLQIMAAEIKNQNPMGSDGGSGSKTDYLSQLAQFTTLDQLTQIGENLNTLNYMGQQQYAFSLIGKEVTLMAGENTITGIVEKAKIVKGFATIQVNGEDYYLGSVIGVANEETEEVSCEACNELVDILLGGEIGKIGDDVVEEIPGEEVDNGF